MAITENESWKANDEINSADNDENLLDTGICNPIIHKECKRKSQSIFEKVDLSVNSSIKKEYTVTNASGARARWESTTYV